MGAKKVNYLGVFLSRIPLVVHLCSVLLGIIFFAVLILFAKVSAESDFLKFLILISLPFCSIPYLMWTINTEGLENAGDALCHKLFRFILVLCASIFFAGFIQVIFL